MPNITGQISNTVILQNLIFLIPKLFAYALSFILLAIFWRVNHQQFYLIKRVNTTLLWINVLFLMLVVLVPFSTSLIGKYGNYQIPMIFFDLNMLLIGVFYNLNWFYAYKKNFLDESVYLDKMGPIRKVSLILPFASLIAIVLTFINPSLSVVAYFSIPFFKNFLKD